jgi:hypothetical protein
LDVLLQLGRLEWTNNLNLFPFLCLFLIPVESSGAWGWGRVRMLYLHVLLFCFLSFFLLRLFLGIRLLLLFFTCVSLGYWSKVVCLTAGSKMDTLHTTGI